MKKGLIIITFSISFIILFVFYSCNYIIKYKVNGYDVITKYNDGRFYFELQNDEYSFNFDIYSKRNLSKTMISNLKVIEGDNFYCVYPTINGFETYPLCYSNGQFIDYTLIDSDLLSEYKHDSNELNNDNDFVYSKNLDSNTYISMWNYKGFIVMNSDKYENISLFEKDHYDNTLSILIDDNIYIADYDQEHEYSKLIKLNVVNLKSEIIDLDVSIDFDSYFVGNIKNNLYIFDNKNSKLYEINLKDDKVILIGSNDIGFKKYENGKFISCSKVDYKVNKIKFNTYVSNYTYSTNDGVLKSISENFNLNQKIINNDISIIKEYQNDIYYINEDYFYKYSPYYGSEAIFYNFEMNFNDNNIFVYNK